MKEYRIAIIGQIAKWKGQDVFIKAAKLLHLNFPKVKFFIIGDVLFNKVEDLLYKNQLLELAINCKFIEFLGHRNDVRELIQNMDVIVHASIREEPFGRVIIEGMAAKKPVIASGIGGPIEIIEDGVNGMLYKPGDEKDLAKSIESLLSNDVLYNELSNEGYHNFINHFEIHRTVSEVEHVILKTLN
ncbi:glycosyltransferase [Metabacillus litoralis]|uniref:glycosyltransferase n=1 Tax=Metabacillus litoralis TaxID=152268 RepID=UPI00203CCE2B|nr:glycosyltransferase [Metabacillus litoralis]MCM3161736.1 glycosyltransferase [Metabacillus litoralis]